MRKDDEKYVIKAIRDYKFSKRIIDLYASGEKFVKEFFTKEQLSKYYLTIECIDLLIDSLDQNSKEFILNQYLYNVGSNWWIYLYSKSTYYRHRENAIKSFVNYLNNQYNYSNYLN